MRTRILAAAAALALALAIGAGSALGASAYAEGQCFSDDDHSSGGGGSVGASSDDPTGADLVDAAEAQSIAAGLATFAQGTADDAPGNVGSDACHNTDDDDGDGFEEDEDGIWGGASAQGQSAGACYDNEGFHTTDECHGGSGGDLPSGAVVLP